MAASTLANAIPRIVEMQGQFGCRKLDACVTAHLTNLAGIGHASGIAQRETVDAKFRKTCHPAQNTHLIDIPFHRATENGRQGH
jgi:hypothetical protein